MIIAHKKDLLDNTYLVDEAERLKSSGFITQEQVKKIKATIPTLKTQNNLFIRICLFILGAILYASICGAISFFGLNTISSESNWKFFVLFFALIGFLLTELVLITNSNYFNNGIDDAFIIGMQVSLVSLVVIINDSNLTLSIAIAIVSALCYFRYLHLPSLIASYLGIVSSLFFILVDYIEYGTQILPFVLLIFAIISYFFSNKLLQKISKPYYYNGLLISNSLSLILGYLAMNYYIVRELSREISDPYAYPSPEIPMAWLFYTFTIITPIFYVFYALKNKNKPMLWVGLIAIGFTIFTIRYYHHIMPLEISLTLAGLFLFSIAYFAIRKLKNKEEGITFLSDRFESTNSLLTIETIVSASQFGIKPEIQEASPMEFGEGGFSGGGAGESF